MHLLYFISIFILCAYANEDSSHSYWFSDEFIEEINSKQTAWRAGRKFPRHTQPKTVERFLGWIPSKTPVQRREHFGNKTELPKSFDARDKWPFCESLTQIRDQGGCGSCWAIAAAAAMTDRICIHSNGTKKISISTQDLTSCCNPSQGCEYSNGCEGGSASDAWNYWKSHGIVSGGPYKSKKGCRPYEIKPCGHTPNHGEDDTCHEVQKTPQCLSRCTVPNKVYRKEKIFAKSAYSVGPSEKEIKAEIYNNGPVEACFLVYYDFLQYESGVYVLSSNSEFSNFGHCVKLLGWGIEKGIKYWLAANSWNTDWGEQGLFKIQRGINMCSIESYVFGGEPAL